MSGYVETVHEVAGWLSRRISAVPEIGLITGTGLGNAAEGGKTASFSYSEIPHFPVSTVAGHQGRLVFSQLAGRSVMALQGRFHLYEGYSAREVTFPIRVMQVLGVKTLFIATAAGGINPALETGDLMLISDHLNLTGENPLAGKNEDDWGPRFPEMNEAYDPALLKTALGLGADLGLAVKQGVYAGLKGPCLETPAEIRWLGTIGADAVGFSTVNEVIAAVHAGMRVLGVAVITNTASPGKTSSVSLADIISVAGGAAPKVAALFRKVLEKGPHVAE